MTVSQFDTQIKFKMTINSTPFICFASREEMDAKYFPNARVNRTPWEKNTQAQSMTIPRGNLSEERLIYARKDSIQARLTDEGIALSEQTSFANRDKSSTSSFCCSNSIENKQCFDFIPYKNILSAKQVEDNENETQLTFVKPESSSKSSEDIVIQTAICYITNSTNSSITDYILQKSYPNKLINPSLLIIINPHGGQAKAKSIYQKSILPVLKAANVNITYYETEYSGHATDIARDLDVSKYDVIACCSGDGIPHEVINGFYQKPDLGVDAFNHVAITQLPCGSGNALSLSTHGSNNASVATWQMLKAHRTKMDLMAVTQQIKNESVTKLSFLSQCYGMIADSDIGTEHLRWLGPIRFDLGVVHKVYTGATYPCEVYVKYKTKNKSEIKNHVEDHLTRSTASNELHIVSKQDLELSGPSLSESVPTDWEKIPQETTSKLNVFYVGKMPYISSDTQFFPAALPNDGYMDLIITDTNTSKIDQTSILLSISSGQHVDDDKVLHAKITDYRLIPKIDPKNHYISIDGENFPFQPIQVEILPKVLTGLLQEGRYIESNLTNQNK